MSDLIERHAAVRKLKKMATQAYIDKLKGNAETIINCCIDVIERQIPSAQPEIIHCKDCKNAKEDSLCGGYWCNGKAVTSHHYCGYAERGEDET